MADTPANLNKFCKTRARDAARKTADENAVRFGLSKAQKAANAAEKARQARLLDCKKREE